jgi:NhaP-type Na+/H+ or K+/H+ antiporter
MPATGEYLNTPAVIYIPAAQTNDREMFMSTDFLSLAMVTIIGLMAGTAIGLFIGYLAKTQRSRWSDMTGREKAINIALIVICSAICITGLAWRFLLN